MFMKRKSSTLREVREFRSCLDQKRVVLLADCAVVLLINSSLLFCVPLVSHKFGYGLMDAGAIVSLAEQWTNVPLQHICKSQEVSEDRCVYSSLVTTGHSGLVTPGHPGLVTTGHSGHVTNGHSGHVTNGHSGHVTNGHTGHVTNGQSGHVTNGHSGHVTNGHTGLVTTAHCSCDTCTLLSCDTCIL
uniref:Uncharacterized protein n=1 Tax=Timema monikensis TaxID=170555 RepID=A0A7R9E269_9NEOP|nr:unnamed protein product [Timema monikensis]